MSEIQSSFSSLSPPTPIDDCQQNIEIKAQIKSLEDFDKKIQIAKNLTSNNGELIQQKDVFFHSKNGRLKLRRENNRPAQLVYYERNDITGPKLSNYDKIMILEEPELLEKILIKSNGKLGVIKKERHLFLYKNCRIHLDKVEDLGLFLEFEVMLKPIEMTVEDGEKFASEMMKIFEINNECLIQGAYMDELLKIKE